jgi:ADP-ribose pyrophosphatase
MLFDILKTNNVYQGRAFRVQQVQVKLPNGKTSNYDLVDHPNSVAVLPVDGEGNILMVRQFRLGANQPLLEVPAGVMEAGEDPEACAYREIREETGQAAATLRKLGSYYLVPGYCTELMHVFLATGLFPDPLRGDEDEFLQVECFSISEIYKMAEKGEIQDSKTMAALLLARSHIFRGI